MLGVFKEVPRSTEKPCRTVLGISAPGFQFSFLFLRPDNLLKLKSTMWMCVCVCVCVCVRMCWCEWVLVPDKHDFGWNNFLYSLPSRITHDLVTYDFLHKSLWHTSNEEIGLADSQETEIKKKQMYDFYKAQSLFEIVPRILSIYQW